MQTRRRPLKLYEPCDWSVSPSETPPTALSKPASRQPRRGLTPKPGDFPHPLQNLLGRPFLEKSVFRLIFPATHRQFVLRTVIASHAPSRRRPIKKNSQPYTIMKTRGEPCKSTIHTIMKTKRISGRYQSCGQLLSNNAE